jgi:hypothetical protein
MSGQHQRRSGVSVSCFALGYGDGDATRQETRFVVHACVRMRVEKPRGSGRQKVHQICVPCQVSCNIPMVPSNRLAIFLVQQRLSVG